MKTTPIRFLRVRSFLLAAGLFLAGAVAAFAAGPALDVLIEEGDPAALEAKAYEQRVSLKNHMTKTLPVKMQRHGIEARVIAEKSEYAGAGAASLDVTHTLYDGKKEIMTWSDGCGTSENWQRLVNKLNDNAVLKLKEHYGLP